MKKYILIFCLLISTASFAQNKNPNFNQKLADSLNADEYGMKSYTFVLLEKGETKTNDPAFVKKCYESHFSNINSLVEKGEIVVSGPFGTNDNGFRGFFIFKSTDIKVVEEMLQNDLAIKEGFLKPKLIRWYGSAALETYLKNHDQIWQKQP